MKGDHSNVTLSFDTQLLIELAKLQFKYRFNARQVIKTNGDAGVENFV